MDHFPYTAIVNSALERFGIGSVLCIDLETIIRNRNDFLSGERIIAISASYIDSDLSTDLFISRGDDPDSELEILQKLDELIERIRPAIIIGYNQTGYDIPLLRMKMAKLPFQKQIWRAKYYLSTAYTLDMMQVISDFLGDYDGDYGYRKLSEVVTHEAFASLPLERKKDLVFRDDMNIGEVILELWKNNSQDFIDYCRGDTRDVLTLFRYIFKI